MLYYYYNKRSCLEQKKLMFEALTKICEFLMKPFKTSFSSAYLTTSTLKESNSWKKFFKFFSLYNLIWNYARKIQMCILRRECFQLAWNEVSDLTI